MSALLQLCPWFLAPLNGFTWRGTWEDMARSAMKRSWKRMIPSQTGAEFLSGYNRWVTYIRLVGDLYDFQGKGTFSFIGYGILARRFMSASRAAYSRAVSHHHVGLGMFCWPFIILQWNLIARTNKVTKICPLHTSWSGNSLVISIPKQKSYQEGNRRIELNANPRRPEICTILGKAVNFFWHSIMAENTFLRPLAGCPVCQASQRRAWKLVRVWAGEGWCHRGPIVTHSVCKNVATMIINHPYSSSVTATFIRAGWKLPGATSRYIWKSDKGDRTLDLIQTGLLRVSEEFLALPPHFSYEYLYGLEHKHRELYVPGCSYYPTRFQHCIPYLVASVVFHRAFLRKSFLRYTRSFKRLFYQRWFK